MSKRFNIFAFSIVCSTIFCAGNSVAFATAFTTAELQALSQQVQSISETHEFACPKPDPSRTLKVFLFDGALGYCPRYYFMNDPTSSSLVQNETFAQRLSETPVTPENAALISEIQKSVGEETTLKNCLLAKTVLENYATQVRAANAQLFYYSLNGNQEAMDCVQTLVNAEALRIRVIGYSMGSDATMQFAQLLNQENQKIEHVLTVDPVGKSYEWVSGVLQTRDNSIFQATPNVVTWTNFYQKQDHGCLVDTDVLHLGIRGSLMIGATTNQELKAADFDTPAHAHHGHVFILSQPVVSQAIETIFE